MVEPLTPTKPPGSTGIITIIRNRIIAGLFVALPLFITVLVIDWIYRFLTVNVIGPIARRLIQVWYGNPASKELPLLPFWIEYILAPVMAVFLVLALLFIAGMLFQSRLHRFLDWILLNVPGVNLIYSAVKNVVDALQRTNTDIEKFERVVLIEFPHPGCKAPAFVTSECIELTTGEVILSVYVPTTPIPTSGYMLLIPEKEVVPLNWNIQQTIQGIVSGGLTIPEKVRYHRLPGKLDLPPSIDKPGSNP